MLTVLSVAYPLAPVGPDAVGGAEQVLTQLDAALVEAGHRSLVVACEGSATRGTLLATPALPTALDDRAKAEAHRRHRETIERALRDHAVDLIHLHGIDFDHYLPPPGVPALVTLHLPPSWYAPGALAPRRPDTHLHCVSWSQHRACPPGTRLLDPIPNGVDTARLRPRGRKRDYAMALGRICPEKGFHLALEAAKAASLPLLLGGEVFGYEAHQAYYRDEIVPRLDCCRRHLGPLGLERKAALLAAAKCLLQPSVAPETSSLVAMEALACGTPVIAFPNGALPDIVEHERTGFLVDDMGGMVRALGRLGEIDPAACREAAERRFSLAQTTARYLDLYERLARPTRRSVRVEVTAVTEVTTGRQLEELRPAWSALWDRVPNATPFQTPEWLCAWWRHVGHGELRTLAVWRGNRLVGLAPLFLYRHPEPPHRRMLLLGTGVTDRMDALLDPAHAAEAWKAIRHQLAVRCDTWDVCEWQELDEGSLLVQGETHPLRAQVSDCSLCPVVALPEGETAWEAGLSSGLRRNLRRYREQLGALGTVEFETATEGTQAGWMDTLFDLHGARWRERGESGVLDELKLQAFHREVAAGLARRGLLRLHGLRLAGRAVAVVYAFAANERAYSYLGGFDPSLSRYSPGTLIMGYSIGQAVREGLREWDFLRGREAYKYVWGAVDEATKQATLWMPGAG